MFQGNCSECSVTKDRHRCFRPLGTMVPIKTHQIVIISHYIGASLHKLLRLSSSWKLSLCCFQVPLSSTHFNGNLGIPLTPPSTSARPQPNHITPTSQIIPSTSKHIVYQTPLRKFLIKIPFIPWLSPTLTLDSVRWSRKSVFKRVIFWWSCVD